MKLKKIAIKQAFIKKLLDINSVFFIFCVSDLTLNLEYKYKKLCKTTFKLPNLLFNFNYSSRVQNYILCKENILLITKYLKLNYYHLTNYGFTFLYFNFFYFKEFSSVQVYLFDSTKTLYFLRKMFITKETLSSSNGKDIALSR